MTSHFWLSLVSESNVDRMNYLVAILFTLSALYTRLSDIRILTKNSQAVCYWTFFSAFDIGLPLNFWSSSPLFIFLFFNFFYTRDVAFFVKERGWMRNIILTFYSHLVSVYNSLLITIKKRIKHHHLLFDLHGVLIAYNIKFIYWMFEIYIPLLLIVFCLNIL